MTLELDHPVTRELTNQLSGDHIAKVLRGEASAFRSDLA
jgi:hypothetical protein